MSRKQSVDFAAQACRGSGRRREEEWGWRCQRGSGSKSLLKGGGPTQGLGSGKETETKERCQRPPPPPSVVGKESPNLFSHLPGSPEPGKFPFCCRTVQIKEHSLLGCSHTRTLRATPATLAPAEKQKRTGTPAPSPGAARFAGGPVSPCPLQGVCQQQNRGPFPSLDSALWGFY